jgi:acyl-CoA synthetase (AMP-forming)/AMP-acid ligase II
MPLISPLPVPPIPTTDLLTWLFTPPTPIPADRPIFISAEHPDDPSQRLTYSQCHTLIRQLITGIRALPAFHQGTCIALHASNSYIYPILELAIVGAGGIFVGTNPAYTKYELEHALKITGAEYILCEAEEDAISSISQAMATSGLAPQERLLVLDVRPGQNIPSQSLKSWRTLLDHGESEWHRFTSSRAQSSTTAAFFFSSGTTGLPKAVQISHRNLIAQHELLFTPHPRPYDLSIVIAVPLFHIGIGAMTLTSILKLGGTAVVMRRFEVERFLDVTRLFAVKEMLVVPPIADAVVKLGDERVGGRLRSIRYGLVGGAACGAVLQREFHKHLGEGAVLGQLLGMTETSCILSMVSPGTPGTDYFGSCGRPIPGIAVKLVTEDGEDVSSIPGKRGELYIKGPTLTRGYFRNAAASAELFDAEGWLRGGDLGYVDEHGWLRLDGRSKELIKVRGFQVSPSEVEEVVKGCPGVSDVAVVAVEDAGRNGEVPRAFVVRDTGGEVTGEEIKRWARERLTAYKQLAGGVLFVDAIPRNASGKILRRLLKEIDQNGRAGSKL